MWYVYIIKSLSHKWFYVGSTNSVERRLQEHNTGRVRSTKAYAPYEVIYITEFITEKEARAYERLLKDKRIEKEKIINKYWGIV